MIVEILTPRRVDILFGGTFSQYTDGTARFRFIVASKLNNALVTEDLTLETETCGVINNVRVPCKNVEKIIEVLRRLMSAATS